MQIYRKPKRIWRAGPGGWITDPERWFAWYPVKIKHTWYWLEYVTRTRIDGDGYGDCWEYGEDTGRHFNLDELDNIIKSLDALKLPK